MIYALTHILAKTHKEVKRTKFPTLVKLRV